MQLNSPRRWFESALMIELFISVLCALFAYIPGPKDKSNILACISQNQCVNADPECKADYAVTIASYSYVITITVITSAFFLTHHIHLNASISTAAQSISYITHVSTRVH